MGFSLLIKVKHENLTNKFMEESGAMAIQISLVAEIDISSLEGNLTSVPKTSDNSVSRNVSQATSQRHSSMSITRIFIVQAVITVKLWKQSLHQILRIRKHEKAVFQMGK